MPVDLAQRPVLFEGASIDRVATSKTDAAMITRSWLGLPENRHLVPADRRPGGRGSWISYYRLYKHTVYDGKVFNVSLGPPDKRVKSH